MLQQNTSNYSAAYFKTWLKRFPDFDHLANASETEVLKAWEGLDVLPGKKSPQTRKDRQTIGKNRPGL